MRAESIFSYATLFGFLLTLARISGVFAMLPLPAFRGAPEIARIVLSVAFTLILRPFWQSPVSSDTSIGRMVAALSAEAALGLAIGLAVAIVLEAFQMAAQINGLQAGLGYASTVDPSSGADSTVLLTIAQLSAGLLFFLSGADRVLIRCLADSLRISPPDSFTLHQAWAQPMIRFSASIFAASLRLAAPMIVLLLLVDFSLAVIGRVQSQLSLITLTIPVKLALTMLLLSSTVALQPRFFESLMSDAFRVIEGIIRNAH